MAEKIYTVKIRRKNVLSVAKVTSRLKQTIN